MSKKLLNLQQRLLSFLVKAGKKTIKSEERVYYSDKWGGKNCPRWSLVQRKEMLYLKSHYKHPDLKAFGFDSWCHPRGGSIARFDLSIDTTGNYIIALLDHHTLVNPDYWNEESCESGRRDWRTVQLFLDDILPTIEQHQKGKNDNKQTICS